LALLQQEDQHDACEHLAGSERVGEIGATADRLQGVAAAAGTAAVLRVRPALDESPLRAARPLVAGGDVIQQAAVAALGLVTAAPPTDASFIDSELTQL
jgi:hypothetical protein